MAIKKKIRFWQCHLFDQTNIKSRKKNSIQLTNAIQMTGIESSKGSKKTHMRSNFPLLTKKPSCFIAELSTSKYSSCSKGKEEHYKSSIHLRHP